MRFRTLALTALCAVTVLGAITPARADDDWRWHERHERDAWREREWRRHEWREHEWREHAWREPYYAPPVVAAPPYGYYVPPPVHYATPGYYR